MRRRQTLSRHSDLRVADEYRVGPDRHFDSAAVPSAAERGAREDGPKLPPAALSYRNKKGEIVSVKLSETGLLMWNGSAWVAAHVIPTKVKHG